MNEIVVSAFRVLGLAWIYRCPTNTLQQQTVLVIVLRFWLMETLLMGPQMPKLHCPCTVCLESCLLACLHRIYYCISADAQLQSRHFIWWDLMAPYYFLDIPKFCVERMFRGKLQKPTSIICSGLTESQHSFSMWVPWSPLSKGWTKQGSQPIPKHQYLQYPAHQLRHASMPKLRNQVPNDISSGASGARQLHVLQDIKRCRAALERAIPAPVVM